VTFVALIIQNWTVHLAEGWSKERAQETLDDTIHVLTLRAARTLPLVFKKR
jgi:hypothetical protein